MTATDTLELLQGLVFEQQGHKKNCENLTIYRFTFEGFEGCFILFVFLYIKYHVSYK